MNSFWSTQTPYLFLPKKRLPPMTNRRFQYGYPPKRYSYRGSGEACTSQLREGPSRYEIPKKAYTGGPPSSFGIRWNAQVYRRATLCRLCRILRSLRKSKLGPTTYRRVSLLWKTASETSSDSPSAWEPWRAAIKRFNLDETKLIEWVKVIHTCIKLG